MNKMEIIYSIIFALNIILVDFVYYKFINKFPIKKWMHFVSIVIPLGCVLFTRFFTLEFFLFTLILEILLILAFTDVVFFEVDKRSYWLILLLSFVKVFALTTPDLIFDVALSPIVVYGAFWVFDKIFGIEKLGGADVKLILILSFYFNAMDVFSFIIWIFIISTIIFIFFMIKQRGFRNIQVPMIVSIAISFFLQRAFFF